MLLFHVSACMILQYAERWLRDKLLSTGFLKEIPSSLNTVFHCKYQIICQWYSIRVVQWVKDLALFSLGFSCLSLQPL